MDTVVAAAGYQMLDPRAVLVVVEMAFFVVHYKDLAPVFYPLAAAAAVEMVIVPANYLGQAVVAVAVAVAAVVGNAYRQLLLVLAVRVSVEMAVAAAAAALGIAFLSIVSHHS